MLKWTCALASAVYLQASSHEVLSVTSTEYTASRISLSGSSWPADHGDNSRSKFTIGQGLPANFSADQLTFSLQPEASMPQWLYTYGENSDYIFAICNEPVQGSSTGLINYAIKKIRSETLEVLQVFPLGPAIYLGGMLMHSNGHVYCVHNNVLYLFRFGDLEDVTSVRLWTRMNGHLTSTNGMLVTSDGYLLVKQWSVNFEDLLTLNLVTSRTTSRLIGSVLLSAVVIAVTLTLFRKRRTSVLITLVVNTAIAVSLAVALVLGAVCAIAKIRAGGPFDPLKFLLTNTVFGPVGGGGGELKVVDPISLEVVAQLALPERCSFARMALYPLHSRGAPAHAEETPTEDAIVLLGDEHVFQLRWTHRMRSLRMLEGWTQRYRRRWEGSFPGTGPAVYNGTAYFTDNTFAGLLFGHSFKLFSRPLEGTVEAPCSVHNATLPPCQPLEGVHLSPAGRPGFFFYSPVISPRTGDVLVWDNAAHSLQARRLADLSLHWEARIHNADCVTVAATPGHVYATDYGHSPDGANAWMTEVVAKSHERQYNVSKHFVVLNVSDGSVIANHTVTNGDSIFVSMIIPGGHGDVLFGTSRALARIFVRE